MRISTTLFFVYVALSALAVAVDVLLWVTLGWAGAGIAVVLHAYVGLRAKEIDVEEDELAGELVDEGQTCHVCGSKGDFHRWRICEDGWHCPGCAGTLPDSES